MKFLLSPLLLLVLSPVICLGLKCYYCKNTPVADNDKLSPCPEGQEIEERECYPGDTDVWNCCYGQSLDGKRSRLGCEFTGPGHLDPDYMDHGKEGKSFHCRRDLCNTLPVNNLKCLTCTGLLSYECAEGEEPMERPCLLDYTMCYNMRRNVSSTPFKQKKLIGCQHPFAFYHYKYSSYSDRTEPFCIDESGKPRETDQACFCFTNKCNTYYSEEDKKEQERKQEMVKQKENDATFLSPTMLQKFFSSLICTRLFLKAF